MADVVDRTGDEVGAHDRNISTRYPPSLESRDLPDPGRPASLPAFRYPTRLGWRIGPGYGFLATAARASTLSSSRRRRLPRLRGSAASTLLAP